MTELITLADNHVQSIEPLLDKPSVFFGHSLGALVAFELARCLRRTRLPQPQILFVSACGAPHLAHSQPPIHRLPDQDFRRSLQQLNGVPAELLDQPEAMQLLLPIVRADLQAIETYAYVAEPPLGLPIFAFGGLEDPRVSRERIEDWALHTGSGFQSRYFPGDHFFINTSREMVITSMIAQLVSLHENS